MAKSSRKKEPIEIEIDGKQWRAIFVPPSMKELKDDEIEAKKIQDEGMAVVDLQNKKFVERTVKIIEDDVEIVPDIEYFESLNFSDYNFFATAYNKVALEVKKK